MNKIATASSYEGLKVFVPAKPKMIKRHILTGDIKCVPVREEFDSEFSASVRKEELESSVIGSIALKIEEKEVPEDSVPPKESLPF